MTEYDNRSPFVTHEAAWTNLELDSSAESALLGMRTWLRGYDGRMARSKIPAQYETAADAIGQVHEAHTDLDPATAIPDKAPRKLLANLIRYNAESDGSADPSNLSFKFLSDLYDLYAKDSKFYQANGFKNASDVALYHNSSYLIDLQSTYEDHDFIEPSDVKKAFQFNVRDPGLHLHELESNIKNFQQGVEPRLREEYGQPGGWSLNFVKGLFQSVDPEKTARNIFDTASQIYIKYPRANRRTVEKWAKDSVMDKGQKARMVEELLQETPRIATTEQDYVSAQADLNLLRTAKLAGTIPALYNVTKKNADIQRLLSMIDLNWHPSFDSLDIENNARRIFYTVKFYNDSLSEDQQQLLVDPSLENTYRILVKFASDVEELKSEGPAWAADKVAYFYDPGVYQRFRSQYEAEPFLTPGMINSFVAEYPAQVEDRVKGYIERATHLDQNFSRSLGSYVIRRLAAYENGSERAQECIDFTEEAMERYPWVTRSNVQRFFIDRSDPETAFAEWVEKVETLTEMCPNDHRFTAFVRKKITYGQSDLESAVESYLSRYNDLRQQYRNNPMITENFCAWWASNSPKSFKEVARSHLERVEQIERLFDDIGEERDYLVIRNIAFSGNDSEARLNKYLEIKFTLKTQFEDDDSVEGWMINQVASSSNTDYNAAYKLRYLRHLKRAGFFNTYIDDTSDDRRSPHELLEDKAWNNIPEDVVIFMESVEERHSLIESLLSDLSDSDRLAVETVFGFSAVCSKAALQEELGIDDLDEYVMSVVVPKMQSLK